MSNQTSSLSWARPLIVLGISLLAALAWPLLLHSVAASQQSQGEEHEATGNLSVMKFSLAEFGGVLAGRPISYTLYYSWSGDEPATNVQLQDLLPAEVTVSKITPPPTSQSGRTLTWNLGTLNRYAFGTVVVEGTVASPLAEGLVFTNTATIAGSVVDDEPGDNRAEAPVKVVLPRPVLWLWKFGLWEEFEEGNFWLAEQGVETTFNLYYYNLSFFEAPGTILTDTLPAGVSYLSAQPAPASVSGQELRWNLGTVPAFGYGEVTVRARPTLTGTMVNQAGIRSTVTELEMDDNHARFQFEVVPLLAPRLLKPNVKGSSVDDPAFVGTRPAFEGLAKSGATVTLYEGSKEGCYGDFAGCHPVVLGSAVAGPDRRWVITPTQPLATRDYYLYLRAEKDGLVSKPPYFSIWEPFAVRVDPRFEGAGWDMDNFVVAAGNQEVRPGGVGGSSGTTPNQDIRISIRQKAPDAVQTNPTLQRYHDLKFVQVDGSERVTETVPFAQVQRVTTRSAEAAPESPETHFDSWDFIYVHKGFGPGSVIEIWCLPVWYGEDGIPLVGLVYVKCHEIVIDPAGYVYDKEKAGSDYEWPQVPPEDALITNATVTVTMRSGDNSWVRWPAEQAGQVNPQVTDGSSTDRISIQGYYAFYVPPGQYQVLATAPHCLPYTSPILTVIDAPIFHNVGMTCTAQSQTGVEYPLFLPVMRRP